MMGYISFCVEILYRILDFMSSHDIIALMICVSSTRFLLTLAFFFNRSCLKI